MDLKDLKRLKLTPETRAWLTAEAHITGRTPQEIAREVLHAKAMERIHAAKVITALAAGEGLAGDGAGHLRDTRGRSK
ncbi:MAG: hypothetical protein U1F35_05270 [Steroidobacteraceae bacterium]